MEEEIERRLSLIEEEIKKGNYALSKLGFWEIVEELKLNEKLIEKYSKRISEINRFVFEKKWKKRYSVSFGIMLLSIISIACIAIFPFALSNTFYLSIYLPIASFILSASLHPITQYLVGKAFKINFIYIYPRGIYIFSRSSKGRIKIEPALKLDYESYLKASPLKRAIMHVSGTFVTIFIVLIFFLFSIYLDTYVWSQIICGVIFFSYLLTELIYSPKYAAWKHFKNEYRVWKILRAKKSSK